MTFENGYLQQGGGGGGGTEIVYCVISQGRKTYAGHPSPVAEEKSVTIAIPKWLKFQSMRVHSLLVCYMKRCKDIRCNT